MLTSHAYSTSCKLLVCTQSDTSAAINLAHGYKVQLGEPHESHYMV